VTRRAELISIYARIGRTYARWAPSLTLLALVVFVPVSLVHAITVEADIGAFDVDGGIELLAILGAVIALAVTGLVGEIFYTGAVAISLTHPRDGDRPPTLRQIARRVDYGTLIAIDLIYGILIAVGLIAFVVPGILAFVWLGLAAPVVEIEHRGVRAAFARSVRLVRGKALLAAAVLIPIELAGNAVTGLASRFTHSIFGSELLCEWLADVLSNVAFTPFYAIAAVLLAVDRIREKDGGGVELHSEPVS
jgi:hypothetical protein